MANETPERIIVTVADGQLGSINTVADALRAAGMQVGGVQPTVGIISGEAAPSKMAALRNVPGVAAVEPDEEMHAI